MFNTIANENVKKYVAILSTPIPDQTKKTAIPPSTRNGKFKTLYTSCISTFLPLIQHC